MTTGAYEPWLVDLVAMFFPRQIPLDVTKDGTYEEMSTRWGENPVYAAVPEDLRRLAEARRDDLIDELKALASQASRVWEDGS
jgi:hypothetical protein